MAINATNNGGKQHEPINAGTYAARCYAMVHIGTIDEQIQNKPIQWINKVHFTFELPTEKMVFDESKGPECRVIGKEFTLSMNEKATLRKFLESWRGQKFTDEQAKIFDVTKLLNVPCLVSVIHKTSSKGNVYTEISSVSMPISGMIVPELTNKIFEFNYDDKTENFPDVPKFIREKVVRSKEWNAIDTPTRTRLLNAAESKFASKSATGTTATPAADTITEPTKPIINKDLPF